MKNNVTAERMKRLEEELPELGAAKNSVQPAPRRTHPINVVSPPCPSTQRQSPPEAGQEIAKLRSALKVLSPDALRGQRELYEPWDDDACENDWLAVVWSVASLDWASGKGLIREWSRQSSLYTDDGFDDAWNAYDPGRSNQIGIGSLYRLAIEQGWQLPADIPQPTIVGTARYKVLSSADIHGLPLLEWRVKDILPATGLAAMFGPSGSGKSFLALDLAAAIACGNPWFGIKTHQAPVVYVMLEGEGAIRNRVDALELAQGQLPAGQFGVIMQPFQLTVPQDVTDLADVLPDGAVVCWR